MVLHLDGDSTSNSFFIFLYLCKLYLESGLTLQLTQTAKQAKFIVLERTNQSIKSINQMTENAIVHVTEATNNTIGSVTEKKQSIN